MSVLTYSKRKIYINNTEKNSSFKMYKTSSPINVSIFDAETMRSNNNWKM